MCSIIRLLSSFLFQRYAHHLDLPSFPTRRSSDLPGGRGKAPGHRIPDQGRALQLARGDRKSTRLNSSHMSISYAVFCLKKKNNTLSVNFHTALAYFTLIQYFAVLILILNFFDFLS